MSGVRAEVQEAGCRMSGGQVGGESFTLSNQKRLQTPVVLCRINHDNIIERQPIQYSCLVA